MNLFDKITGINSRVIPGSNKTDAFGSASNFFGTAPTNQSIMPTAYKPTQAPTIRPQVQSPVVQKQQGQISNMFSDEKKAYEAMKADGIPDEEALKVIGERRKNIRDTVGIPGINSKEEQDALNKMRADGVDAITAAGLIKQYRSQFKDLETQKFEEAYKKGNLFQKGAYNLLAGAAGNLETIAKYGGNVLDFATMGKAGFGEEVKKMKEVTQAPEFQSSSAYKAGTYLPDVALGVSPIGGGYLAGAKGALGLAGRSAVVGAGFGATQPVLEKGSEATMGDIATGGAVGGVAGGVLSPVIGIAGKGIIKGAEKIGKYGTALKKGGLEGVQKSVARDISAFKAPGVETVTRNIPKAVVRRDLGFTPTERAKIEKITGQDEGTYILSKGLAGKGKEELAEVFMKQSDDMYNGITRDLSKVNAKVQSPVAKEALLDIVEQLESSPKIARAYAKDIQGVKEMLARDEFTLSELNNIRRAYDKVNTGMFTVQGKARSGLENAIDVKVRQDLSNQLQKEAKKYGVDVKAMNTELRAGLEMKDALLRRLSQEERNNFIGLQDLGVSAILSGGEPVSAVATIVAKKYAEKVAPGLSQKLYNLNKAPNVTRNVSRGNTITPRNKSSQLGLASNSSSPVVSNVVKPKVTPKKITPTLNKNDEYLYHGTNKYAFEKIKEEGIKPQKRGVSSLSIDEDYSKNFAFPEATGTKGEMLRVKKSFMEGKIFNTKKQRPKTDEMYEILTKETIPPEAIEVFKDGKWQPIVNKTPKTIKDPTKTTVNLSQSKGGFIRLPGGKSLGDEALIQEANKAKEIGKYDNSYEVTKGKKLYRGGNEDGVFWTDDIDIAKSFGDEGVIEKTITIKKPLDVRSKGIRDYIKKNTNINIDDATSAYSRSLPEFKKLMKWAEDNGYDGIIGKTSDNGLNFTGNEFITLSKPKSIKGDEALMSETEGQKLFKERYKGLDNNQLEEKAIRAYVNGGVNYDMNGLLRGKDMKMGKTYKKFLEGMKYYMETYMNNSKKYTGDVIRGLMPGSERTKNLINGLKIGDTFTDDGFISTTMGTNISKSYDLPVKFHIKSKSGVDISKYSNYPDEKEVLFKPKTSFKITNIKNGNQGTDIYMEEI